MRRNSELASIGSIRSSSALNYSRHSKPTPLRSPWHPRTHRRRGTRKRDAKLGALEKLLTKLHPNDKVLVFTQFADTAQYLGERELEQGEALTDLAVVTNAYRDPVTLARRFSPSANGGSRGR
ncbi:MAG: hypothetical protein KatS3mg040_1840 [Candidatus Kapaibacterium sp.]|nr:MAG: hypothetical protein KatS3mg040_1840 [Candidatus Kapabacteria bacterium]